MSSVNPRGIVVTGDVHSHLSRGRELLDGLAAARPRMLVADSGDFFEGSGYYRLGGGVVEREILARLYDVVMVGNHGFAHYLADPRLRTKVVCANLVDATGRPVFQRARHVRIGGVSTVVTGVIGEEAFATIPAAERAGLRVENPAAVLTALAANRPAAGEVRRALVVLSHSGWAADLLLARHCPFITVIFSGHCHSDRYGPELVGPVLVVKGAEHAVGYAWAQPGKPRWQAKSARFQPPAAVRPGLADLHEAIGELSARLARRLGPVRVGWAGTVPDRGELLARIAQLAVAETRADAAVFNHTVLRPPRLDAYATRGTVLETAPFATRLVAAQLDEPDAVKLPAHLTPLLGPILSHGDLHVRPRCRVVTTDYIAETHLGVPYEQVGLLDEYAERVLTGREEGP